MSSNGKKIYFLNSIEQGTRLATTLRQSIRAQARPLVAGMPATGGHAPVVAGIPGTDRCMASTNDSTDDSTNDSPF